MLSRTAATYSGNPLVRYVNVTINNPMGDANRTATFDWQYDRTILNNAGEHMCGVVSFSLPLQNLPLFIFPIVANQARPNKSTLEVGICENMSQTDIANAIVIPIVGTQVSLQWVPQEMGITIPTQNQATQVMSPYYYCYAYEHFVNIVNDAVGNAWVQEGSPGGPNAFPEFSYDDDKHTFRWRLPTAFAGNVGAPDGYTVCWNEAFDNLVNNFNTINNGGTFLLEDTLIAETNTVSGNIILNQDYPATDALN